MCTVSFDAHIVCWSVFRIYYLVGGMTGVSCEEKHTFIPPWNGRSREQDIQYQNEMFSASYYNRTIPQRPDSLFSVNEPRTAFCLHLSMIFHLGSISFKNNSTVCVIECAYIPSSFTCLPNAPNRSLPSIPIISAPIIIKY